eukprot:12374788-Alexandrium_andersonii.AAC.1
MPLVAATRLAGILGAAEMGKGWPTALCAVLSAFVAKTAHHSVKALDYRALALLSSVYRTWAK